MKNTNSLSIKNQLLGWLLVPLSVLWILSAVITFMLAESYANSIYDEQLLNSADSVIARLRLKESGMDVDLPPAAIAVLRHNFKDSFYFQVISSDGKLVDGDEALSMPRKLVELKAPVFGDDFVYGAPVRTLLVEAPVEEAPGIHVFVYVAETLETRKALARHVLFNTILSQLAVISLGALAVWFGVSRGLNNLELLRRDVAARSETDLSPLNAEMAPLEVRPLVQSINNLLGILGEDLEAKQRFVANAAHQLRTPLAGLKTYIGILKKLVTNPGASEVLNQLDAGADRTTHLVNRLLALAKVEPSGLSQSKHVVLDLNSVASEAAAQLVPEAVVKNIDLSFEASDDAALVIGDREGLHELAANIIENALRYTPENGIVSVRVTAGEKVGFVVEDSGPGIPPEEREKVFERFYRILGTGISGSGLGLAIVNEIAKSHNARVLLGPARSGTGTKVQVEFLKANSFDDNLSAGLKKHFF